MNLIENNPDIEYLHVPYQNSGDLEYSEKNRVVGYHAFAVRRVSSVEPFNLSEKDKNNLLQLARLTLEEYLSIGNVLEIQP